MKNYKILFIKSLLIAVCLPLLTACWKDLPAYEEAEITKVGFYHRFPGPNIDSMTQEPIMIEKELSCKYDINSEEAVIKVKVTVPPANGVFTEIERDKVKQSALWGYVNLSTAARIAPLKEAKPLGTKDDWTKEHDFVVKAANGKVKTWTIQIESFNK